MPRDAKLAAALDLTRFHALTQMADLGGNLWEALRLASERGDADIVRHHVKQIIVLVRSVNELTKHLGSPEADDARQ